VVRRLHFIDGPLHGVTKTQRNAPPTVKTVTLPTLPAIWAADEGPPEPTEEYVAVFQTHTYHRAQTTADGTALYIYAPERARGW
jgi:hypothetical protein